MKDLMWEMFRSTGHVCAYLLYKEYEKGDADTASDFDAEEHEHYQQKIPVS